MLKEYGFYKENKMYLFGGRGDIIGIIYLLFVKNRFIKLSFYFFMERFICIIVFVVVLLSC